MTALDNSLGRGRKLPTWNSQCASDTDAVDCLKVDLPDLPQVKVTSQFTLLPVNDRTLLSAVTLTPPSSLSPSSGGEGGRCEGGEEEEEEADYDNVSSPCSSTASGPIVIRRPGFTHYAQQLPGAGHRLKKQKLNLVSIHQPHRNDCRRREPTPPKGRIRRDNVPMRLRALPQSFFQQPNRPLNVEPTAAYPVLPPLFLCDTPDVRPVTPPEEREKRQQVTSRPPLDSRITVTNLDLLNKLFDNIDSDRSRGVAGLSKTSLSSIKRSRSNKHVIIATNNKSLLSGHDPHLVEAMTEKLFPQLGLDRGVAKGGGAMGGATVQLVSVREGERTLMLPSLTVEQNLPHLLSELVTHI